MYPSLLLQCCVFPYNPVQLQIMSESELKIQNHQHLLKLNAPDHDQLNALLQREDDYLNLTSCVPKDELYSSCQGKAKWRPKIFEWFYKIIDHFGFDRDIVAVGMDLLDRFQVLCAEEIDGEMYQRAAMTCLLISIKISGGADSTSGPISERQTLDLHEYASLSRGQFSVQDLIEMELHVFETLQWRVNPVIPTNFLCHILSLVPSDPTCNLQFVLTVIYEVARYLIEVCIISSDISFYFNFDTDPAAKYKVRPSTICHSAVLISMELVSEQIINQEMRKVFSSRVTEELQFYPEDIQLNRRLILDSLIPTNMLDGNLTDEIVLSEIQKLHPIAIFEHAGVLNENSKLSFVKTIRKHRNSRKRKHPLSPTSISEV